MVISQQEIGEAASNAELRFYEMYPEKHMWTNKSVDEWVRLAVEKVVATQQGELRKFLPVADPKHTPAFLEQVKVHYEKNESPEMQQEKLHMFATSAIPTKMKIKWLERWNSPESIRKSHRFPKPSFADTVFPPWLHRATWWAQVFYFNRLSFFGLI